MFFHPTELQDGGTVGSESQESGTGMGFVITGITSQNQDDSSDDDVIEVVRDEAPIQIISDDDDEINEPQNSTVIKNYHFMPPSEIAEPKHPPDTPITNDPLDNISHSTDSENMVPSPNAEELLLSEPPPPGTEDTNNTVSPSIEANGTVDDHNSVPIKLPILLPGLSTDPKDLNNKDEEDQSKCPVETTNSVIDAKV